MLGRSQPLLLLSSGPLKGMVQLRTASPCVSALRATSQGRQGSLQRLEGPGRAMHNGTAAERHCYVTSRPARTRGHVSLCRAGAKKQATIRMRPASAQLLHLTLCLCGCWQAALGTAEPPELLLLTQLLPRRWSAYLRSAPIDDVRRVSTRKAPTAPAPYAMP